MLRKPRDFKAEYARRIARGLNAGLTRSQARGHPAKAEKPVRKRKAPAALGRKFEKAVRALRAGESQRAAARAAGISVERFRRHIYANNIANREGSRWVMVDNRARRVPTIYRGEFKAVTVQGFDEASRAGKYHNAVGHFVRTNDYDAIEPFEGQGLTDHKGRFHPFETDPNELHRYATADNPAFHEIYQIISTD